MQSGRTPKLLDAVGMDAMSTTQHNHNDLARWVVALECCIYTSVR